jgi:hypothetical protein
MSAINISVAMRNNSTFQLDPPITDMEKALEYQYTLTFIRHWLQRALVRDEHIHDLRTVLRRAETILTPYDLAAEVAAARALSAGDDGTCSVDFGGDSAVEDSQRQAMYKGRLEVILRVINEWSTRPTDKHLHKLVAYIDEVLDEDKLAAELKRYELKGPQAFERYMEDGFASVQDACVVVEANPIGHPDRLGSRIGDHSSRHCRIVNASVYAEDGGSDGAYDLHGHVGSPQELGAAIADGLATLEMARGGISRAIEDRDETLEVRLSIKVSNNPIEDDEDEDATREEGRAIQDEEDAADVRRDEEWQDRQEMTEEEEEELAEDAADQ